MATNEHIVVFGFGSQGNAQALNLRDGGLNVSVCMRPKSRRFDEAKASKINIIKDLREGAKIASVASVLISDGEQAAFYKEVLEPNLPKGAALVFAHGFAIHYRQIVPRTDLDVVLVAPLAHASRVRSDFISGGGVPCLIAMAQDATGRAHERALSYAKGISKTGPFTDTTFAEEVEIDLFVEQAVLCGGVPELVRASFDALVKAGYKKEIAHYCCLKELLALVKLMDEHGIAGMRERISDTALYGALTRGPRIIGKEVRKELEHILDEIRSNEFARELIAEQKKGSPLSKELLKIDKEHLIEKMQR